MQFRNTQGKPCSWLNSFESPEESIEIDRGVVVNRRWVFGAGAAAAVGLALPFAPRLFAQEANPLIKESTKLDENAISLEQFLSETRPAARTMVKSKVPDEEAFIELAMQQLGRLESIEASRDHPGGKGWTMDMSAYVPPIMLYQIRMEPNSVISLHDHRFPYSQANGNWLVYRL